MKAFSMKVFSGIVLLFVGCTVQQTNTREKEAFEKAEVADWEEVFSDSCTGDWTEQWFLDGEVASVSNDKKGMQLTAGPQFKKSLHGGLFGAAQPVKLPYVIPSCAIAGTST